MKVNIKVIFAQNGLGIDKIPGGKLLFLGKVEGSYLQMCSCI